MALEKDHIVHLLQRYKQNACTETELKQLQYYLSENQPDQAFEEALSVSLLELEHECFPKESKLQELYQSIAMKTTETRRRGKRLPVWSYVAAASILLIAAVAIYNNQRDTEVTEVPSDLVAESTIIAPGGNRATLTLGDGRVVTLSEQERGIVMSDQIQYEDGRSVLGASAGRASAVENLLPTVSYTLATPRGGTYQLTLPDGTKVWLNAASSLTYPEQFGNERMVTLDGEAYFVVAPDSRKAFKVISKGQEVEVLGTEFNVSAYPDATSTSTTLVKGRVKVISANGSAPTDQPVLLEPGQQAENSGGVEIAVRAVNIASYVAWKEGVFYFDETELTDAMDQLSRWYDLEVSYQGSMPPTHFYGEISRDKTLNEVLAILQEGGVRFRIEQNDGRNEVIVISP